MVKTSALVSAAWFIAHWRDFRAASGNSQNTEFQSGLTNCSGWCITSPQNRACSPRELKLMQGLDGIERQFGDLDDCGIAYAVGYYCHHIATPIGPSSGARLGEIHL